MNNDTSIKPAATVIILSQENNPQIYLVKQKHEHKLFGQIHVFPGGKVEEADIYAAQRAIHYVQQASFGFLIEELPYQSLGFVFAAIRETAEETGLLFARDQGSGELVSADLAQSICSELQKGQDFYALLSNNKLRPAHELLSAYSWWITPEIETRRYDTRFFIARAPSGQLAQHNHAELSDSVWLTPEQALESFASDKIRLAPPTLSCIEQLALELFQKSAAIQAICPQAKLSPDGRVMLLLPGDELYEGSNEAILPHRTRFCLDAQGRVI